MNAWKNAENEEKTGRIEAKLMPITYRKVGFVLGATFCVILASLLEDRTNILIAGCVNKSVVKQINSTQRPVRVQSSFLVSLCYLIIS